MAYPLYRLKTTYARPVEFEKVYKTSDEAKDNLAIVTVQRERVVQVMKQSKELKQDTPEELEQMLESYLPYIITMTQQVSVDPAKCEMKKKLEIVWSSALEKLEKNQTIRAHSYKRLNEECAHCFVLLAYLKYQQADCRMRDALNVGNDEDEDKKNKSAKAPTIADLYETDEKSDGGSVMVREQRAEVFKDVARLLKEAAGVFQFAHETLLPMIGPLDKGHALDLSHAVLQAMELLCLGNAQELAIITAVDAGKFTPQVLAKLSMGVADKFGQVHETIVKGLKDRALDLDVDFTEYIRDKISFYKAIAQKYMARHAFNEKKWGESVGRWAHAKQLMTAVKLPSKHNKNPGLLAVKAVAANEFVSIKQGHAEAEADNGRIYYELVPEPKDIPLPDSMFMPSMKAIPFVPPEPLDTPLFDVPVDKSQCIIS